MPEIFSRVYVVYWSSNDARCLREGFLLRLENQWLQLRLEHHDVISGGQLGSDLEDSFLSSVVGEGIW